jgi:hypothetical protein
LKDGKQSGTIINRSKSIANLITTTEGSWAFPPAPCHMDLSIFVPGPDLFLAMLVAFGLSGDIKDCKLVSEDATTTITRTAAGDSITLALTDDLGTTRYTFRGTKVFVSSMIDWDDGKKHEAKGSYDLTKEFGIADPRQLAKAAEVTLRANGKNVTLRLVRAKHQLSVIEAGGDPPGVFGYSFPRTKGTFPPATVSWK